MKLADVSENNKKLSYLLIAQLILVLLVWWPKAPESVGQKYLFEGFDFTKVSEISIAAATKAENSESVQLVKQGDAWVVPAAHEYPASEEKVKTLFDKFKGIERGLVISKTKPSYERLEVSDEKFERKVSFKAGKEDGFYLGSSPQFKRFYIRKISDQNVYSTSSVSDADLPTKVEDWLEKKVLNISSEQIIAINIGRGRETLKFLRKEREVKPSGEQASETATPQIEKYWELNGKAVNKAKFDALLRKIANLELDQVLGAESKQNYGLKVPKAKVSVTVQDANKMEQVMTFHVGRKVSDQHVVQREGSKFFVAVGPTKLEEVLQTKRKEFIAP